MYYLRKEPYSKEIFKDGEVNKIETIYYNEDRGIFKHKNYSRLYRMNFFSPENDVNLYLIKDLKKALRERVNLWWYCNEWFDIYDYDTNKKIDEKLYLEYKPLPLDIYHTTRTLYYSEEEGEIVDDKPRFGYFETYRVGTKLKVYKWLDWYEEWDSVNCCSYEEFQEKKSKIVLVTNNGKHLFTYNDIYELQDEECAWFESDFETKLRKESEKK